MLVTIFQVLTSILPVIWARGAGLGSESQTTLSLICARALSSSQAVLLQLLCTGRFRLSESGCCPSAIEAPSKRRPPGQARQGPYASHWQAESNRAARISPRRAEAPSADSDPQGRHVTCRHVCCTTDQVRSERLALRMAAAAAAAAVSGRTLPRHAAPHGPETGPRPGRRPASRRSTVW